MAYTHIFWDFNGTILDDVQIGIDSINTVLTRRNLPRIGSAEEYSACFEIPVLNYYKRIGLCEGPEDFTEPANEWVAEYLRRVPQAPLYPDVRAVLEAVRARHIPQIVLSATEQTMLERQLNDLGIAGFFEEILGQGDVYGRGKGECAARWAEAHPQAHAVLIGDTAHDAETARLLRADCFLVSAGHQPAERLRECGCPVFGSLTELLPLLQ